MSNEELVSAYKAEPNNGTLEKLYLQNKGIIFQVAKSYCGMMELEDLGQEAYFVLLEAVNQYSEERRGAFVSYFAKMLHWKFRRLCKASELIKLPEHRMDEVLKFRKARETMKKSEIMGLYGWDEETYKRASRYSRLIDLARADEEDENGKPLLDKLYRNEKETEAIEEAVDLERKRAEIDKSIDQLSGNLPDIIRLRYYENLSFREIGEKLNISLHEAKRRHDSALKRLKLTRAIINLAKNEYIYSEGIKNTGSSFFSSTFTSATERTAINLAEKNER